jgi:hypothetical protein
VIIFKFIYRNRIGICRLYSSATRTIASGIIRRLEFSFQITAFLEMFVSIIRYKGGGGEIRTALYPLERVSLSRRRDGNRTSFRNTHGDVQCPT